jgi:hypothetical protein
MELIGWGSSTSSASCSTGGRQGDSPQPASLPARRLVAGQRRRPRGSRRLVALAGTAAAKLGEEERPVFELGRNAVDSAS